MSLPWQNYIQKGKKEKLPLCVCVCVCVCVCQTLYNPMDCSPPGSSVHGIFQARILEQAAIYLTVKDDAFSLRSGNEETKKFTLITYLNTVWEVLASAKSAIGNKRHIDEKGKKKNTPISDYMIVFVENSKEPTKTKKPLRINKWIQQSCSIQEQNTKLNCFYIPAINTWT